MHISFLRFFGKLNLNEAPNWKWGNPTRSGMSQQDSGGACLTPSALLGTGLLLSGMALIKIVDVILHAQLPWMHTVAISLRFCFLAGPTIVGNTVNCDHSTGSVDALRTVNKHRLI